MTRADRTILNETYRMARNSADVIRGLIRKTEDEDLAVDLNRQLGQYQRFLAESETYFRTEGEQPVPEPVKERAKSWLHIQSATVWNNSTTHIADMVIQEHARSIADMMKTLHNNKTVRASYCEFANELMDFAESSINQLKYYLKVV